MKKLAGFLTLLPIGVFVLALILGATYKIPFFYGLAMASLSVVFAIKGAEAIIERKSVAYEDEGPGIRATYKGVSAIMNGLFWLVVSVLLFISAIPVALSQGEWLAEWLKENPGICMITCGLIAVILGIQNMFGSEEMKRTCLTNISGRIFGFCLFVAGIALIPGGAMKIVSPGLLDQVLTFMESEGYRLLCQANIYCRAR